MTRQVGERRPRLHRDHVLEVAVALADEHGIEALSMRRLADELGVVPMALYKHVASKEELLDAMVDRVVDEIGPSVPPGRRWRASARARILTARSTMLRHPWARRVIETRTARSPIVLTYLDSVAAILLGGGLTPELVHHSMHAIGSRVWGFTQDVFETDVPAPEPDPDVMAELAARLPSLVRVASAVSHDTDSAVGYGCDDQYEFEFALDLLLDGIARLHRAHWQPPARS
ncbi:MAG TPA: TetR/AcrR family transcriptional regulator [Microthrixaceae bacterium]|nr:TetR/AcrR family transcriptional regulator [Microthrixaceae bacterium]HMT23096.1 TetR/AcrR family transcriptional regulator [Microthrixaceae bacterium]HMT59523.1 TetR/AcrR family transcriptional regulator [Microthrixaceae bacterium]